mmetsp:Transcript_6903/g.26655  ORF Transcript_6903/g.26655 Transcript_6903/m.26655 type:complete len:256 (+) Transcript_6903:226-993(+)
MCPPVKPRRCHLVQPAREAQVVGYRVLDGLQIHLIDRLAWRVALPLVRLLCASCDSPRAAPRHGHSSGPELMQRRLTNRPGLLQILQNSADLVPEARSRPKKRPLLLQVAAQFLEPLRVPRLVPQHPFHLLLQHVHVRFWPPLVLDAIGPLQCTQLRHRFATVVLLLHLQAQGLRIVLQGFPRSRLQQVPIPTAASTLKRSVVEVVVERWEERVDCVFNTLVKLDVEQVLAVLESDDIIGHPVFEVPIVIFGELL